MNFLTAPLLLGQVDVGSGANPAADFLGSWMFSLLVVAAVVGLLLQIANFWRNSPVTRAELEAVIAHQKDADREVESFKARVDERFATLQRQLTEEYRALQKSDEARAGTIHHRLNAMGEQLGEIRGELRRLRAGGPDHV